MNWTWKHAAAGYTVVAFAVWLILYIVEWNMRNKAGMGIGDALLDWVGDVVMLQWVKGYQGLIGGVFTLVAGGFVFVAAFYQRKLAEADRVAARAERLVTTLVNAQTRFRKLYTVLARNGYEDARSTLPTLDLLGDELSFHSTLIGSWVQYLAMEITRDLERVNPPGAAPHQSHLEALMGPERPFYRNSTRAMANTVVGLVYFTDIERLIDADANFKLAPASAADLEKRLTRLGNISLESLPLTEGMFA